MCLCVRERELECKPTRDTGRERERNRERVVLLALAAKGAPFHRGGIRPRVKMKKNYGSCLEKDAQVTLTI